MYSRTYKRLKLLRRLQAIGFVILITPNAWTQPATTPTEDDVFDLSPFEVNVSENVGYYAANTLAGSRLNTRITDLAASITVVTMEQIEDTASTDLNDVFRYEANTEGADTYTPAVTSLRGDGVVDANAGFTSGADGVTQSHNSANRIRGIGAPGRTWGYYQSIPEVPFDSYNTSSVEISRGPNSLLFGMGNPAGIVNQNLARAQFRTNYARVRMRFDDRGSIRSSFNFNRELIPDRLAIYGAILKDDRSFERKPSYDNTERAYGAISIRPLDNTIIRASVEGYQNRHRRPNTMTPRDAVTEWRTGGKWSYNPSTGELRSLATGETKGPLALRANSPRIDETRAWIESLPDYDASLWNANRTEYKGVPIFGPSALVDPESVLYTPGMELDNNSRPKFRLLQGEMIDYLYFRADNYRRGYGTPLNPAGNAPTVMSSGSQIYNDPIRDAAYNTHFSASSFHSAYYTNVGNYLYPGVTDRTIYDWTRINTLQMNFGEKENITYNIELEQRILPSLILNLGYFRQEFEQMTSYTVSQLNTGTIQVDTNTHLPDGSINEMFGLPVIIGPTDPDRFYSTTDNQTSRAMLAWTPDFTDKDGWLRHLGRHQAIGLASRYHTMDSRMRDRWYIIDSDEGLNESVFLTNNPNPDIQGNPTGYTLKNRSVQRMWYLASPGDTQDGTVRHSPGAWGPTVFEGDMPYFNWESRSWEPLRYETGFVTHDATTGRLERQVDSLSVGLTSFLWNNRLITTVGWREDRYKARGTTNGPILDKEGSEIEPAMTDPEMWVEGFYQTETVFNRWQRWDRLSGNTSTKGVVLRPFDNRPGIRSEFLRSLGFSYNRSDNFNPPDAAQVDPFGNELPKPTGKGEDWGVQFSLFEERLFARINWFKATNDNERTNPGTSLSRFNSQIDRGTFRQWAYTIAKINAGYDPTDGTSWDSYMTPQEEREIEAAASDIWGLPWNYYEDLPGQVYATRSAEARGMEIEITFNPTRNWTMRFTGGKQETKYANVMREYFAWYDQRTPHWFSASAQDFLRPEYHHFVTYTTESGRNVNLGNFWSSYGYTSAVSGDDPFIQNVEGYFMDIVEPQVAIATELEGQASPGQRKYRANFITNYRFADGALKGWNVGGAVRWEDRAIIGYYGRPNPATDDDRLTLADVNRPIYDSGNTRFDLWVGYRTRLDWMNADLRLRLNVVDAFESGRLQPVRVNYDGSPHAYRIVDPRQFILTVDLDF